MYNWNQLNVSLILISRSCRQVECSGLDWSCHRRLLSVSEDRKGEWVTLEIARMTPPVRIERLSFGSKTAVASGGCSNFWVMWFVVSCAWQPGHCRFLKGLERVGDRSPLNGCLVGYVWSIWAEEQTEEKGHMPKMLLALPFRCVRSSNVELKAQRAALCAAWSPNGDLFAVGQGTTDVGRDSPFLKQLLYPITVCCIFIYIYILYD